MKKVMILSIALLAAIALAATAFAADTGWGKDTKTLGSGSDGLKPVATYGLSSNVWLRYWVDDSHTNYTIASGHWSGNREFGSANATTLIYYQTKVTGVASGGVALPSPSSTATFGSGWTAL
jgi:hypothetical protein